MEIKLLELFGGIGSQTQALTNIGIKHKATLCEIDKYAVKSYEQMHGKTENLGDITKVKAEDLHEGQWDLITYSFPCQSVSVAGKQEGLTKGTGTTSSLLWECEKIISKVKPKYLLMENVANLLSEKFMPEFEKWLRVLKDLGYTNYYQILNAKNYGIPQNRERVFCVSIRGKHSYYQFPQPIPLDKKLKDLLEDSPDKKYYIKQEICEKFKLDLINKEISNCIRTGGKDSFDKKHSWNLVVVVDDSIKPSVAKNFEREKEKIVKSNREIYQVECDSAWQDNKVGIKVSPTIRANNPTTHALDNHFRIRKLTPRECWRLMGWTDEQFNKIKGVSNTHLYKQAGNSIVVTVLEAIFRQLFLVDSGLPQKQEYVQEDLF